MADSKRKALIAGSFDPVTSGHLDIIKRASTMFDTIYVVCFNNTSKKNMFTPAQREEMLRIACSGLDNVITSSHEGLLADFAKEHGINVIIKGIRDSNDLAYELDLATINRTIDPDLDTIFMPARPELTHISSSFVRDVIKYGRYIKGILPDGVEEYIRAVEKPVEISAHEKSDYVV